MAKISVIVPAYNTANTIHRCLKSILNQTFSDFEIIIVDDGSPDKIPSIIDNYSKEHLNIKALHKNNGGLTSARYFGYLHAQGEYICFLDSDDYIHKDYLKDLYDSIVINKADIAICSYYLESNNQTNAVFLPYQKQVYEGVDIQSIFVEPLLGKKIGDIKVPSFVWNKLYARKLITPECFKSEREFYLEDHIFNLEYAKSVKKISIINEPRYYYVINENSLTNRYRFGKWDLYKNLEKYFDKYCTESLMLDAIPPYCFEFMHSWVFDSIDNAAKSRNYSRFKNEVKTIIEDPVAQLLLNNSNSKKWAKTEVLMSVLTKYKMYKVLYLFRLWRQWRVYG